MSLRTYVFWKILKIVIVIVLFSVSLHSNAQEKLLLRSDLLINDSNGVQFLYPGSMLYDNWQRLHKHDSIEFPSEDYVARFRKSYPQVRMPYSNKDISFKLQEAWRLFHAGQFKEAYQYTDGLGLIGVLPKLRILSIHHHFYIENKKIRRNAFKEIIKEIERIQTQYKFETPALYLLKAFCIGRYGQDINPVNAFAKGLGGKLKKNIYRAAELAPDNVEALMFKAVFHAEVIAYIGNLTGRLLYGSSRSRALGYFDRAISKNGENSALLLEYGKACLRICDEKEKQKGINALNALMEINPQEMTDLKNMELAKRLLGNKV